MPDCINRRGYEFYLPAGGRNGIHHICSMDGDKVKPRFVDHERKGGSGFGISTENVAFTLSCRYRHVVAVFRRK